MIHFEWMFVYGAWQVPHFIVFAVIVPMPDTRADFLEDCSFPGTALARLRKGSCPHQCGSVSGFSILSVNLLVCFSSTILHGHCDCNRNLHQVEVIPQVVPVSQGILEYYRS